MSSLDTILSPRSIAVCGASRKPNTVGWNSLGNLLENKFNGPVYPVYPKADWQRQHAVTLDIKQV